MIRPKKLSLNFFPLAGKSFTVQCFRRKCESINEAKPNEGFYHFWEKSGDTKNAGWWLSTEQEEGFEPFTFASKDYPHVAKWVLTRQLLPVMAKAISDKGPFQVKITRHFWPKLEVGVVRHEGAGWQGFILEFDWNSQERRLGIYANFRFFRTGNTVSHEQIQKLSLSLDKRGGLNRDLYRNRHDWLINFYKRFLKDTIFVLHNGTEFAFENLLELQGEILDGKTLEFSRRELDRNAYWGLKKFGPYQRCEVEPTFFFVFREAHRPDARFLYECLCGREFHDRFPGMTEFFKIPFGRQHVRHVVLEGSNQEAFAKAAKEIADAGCPNAVAVVLVSGDEHEYLLQKAACLEKNIPSQDVKISNIRSGRNFQWSVAGVALQLFCKAGGIPWCVQTRSQHDLIIGVSQLWNDEEGDRKRYVAYAVTTDANGFFKDIRTLSDSMNENDYVAQLGERIKSHLVERIKIDAPERIVLHCSFRLRKSAMDTIRRIVADVQSQNAASQQIVIMRVNAEHHYEAFDMSRATMVPDENSVLAIKKGCYLVWPDGTPAGGVMPTRPSGPLFVSFDKCKSELSKNTEIELLQGLCDLSGANWRGFNARARPVSVFYCQLVGRMMSDMAKYKLELPKIEKMGPWFL